MEQLTLSFIEQKQPPQQVSLAEKSYLERLISSLSSDLNFQENANGFHPAHKVHSFPAKFPPQLPRKFILALTEPGDIVLDPMVGSGTTLLESFLLGRQAVGVDIDPVAILLCHVKNEIYADVLLRATAKKVITEAYKTIKASPSSILERKANRFNSETCKFIDYWFSEEVQIELIALLEQIETIPNPKARDFFKLVFSSTIITKNGGVSLALDLAHTRPHRAQTVLAQDGKVILGDVNNNKKHLTKKLRSPIHEFQKKFENSLNGTLGFPPSDVFPIINYGNAKALPIESNSVDLIVTSPPYASNAIDYMRAHKFSLIWFGYPINELTHRRKTYIGSDGTFNGTPVVLPASVQNVVSRLSKKSKSKSASVHRYYSEMTLVLGEMYRVLKPGKASIVVVGNSTLSGEDVEIEESLIAIGQDAGFEIPKIGIRQLDRNRRMLPAGTHLDMSSQIQQRMHEEYVIGFYKPE